jgi:hypothetical protein
MKRDSSERLLSQEVAQWCCCMCGSAGTANALVCWHSERKGTSTLSCISSCTIETAGSKVSGGGGSRTFGTERISSRMLHGRFTSRGPSGTMYAANNFAQSLRTYAQSLGLGADCRSLGLAIEL